MSRLFCNSTFWNADLTWNTDFPELTPCLHALVSLVPCIVLAIILPFYLGYIVRNNKATRSLPLSPLHVFKLIASVALATIKLLDVFKAATAEIAGRDPEIYLYVMPFILFLAYLSTAALLAFERRKGVLTSGPLFIFWLLTLIFAFPQMLSYCRALHNHTDNSRDAIEYFLYYVLVIAQLIASCIVDALPQSMIDDKNISPELTASFASFITFHWFNDLCWKGFRKGLTEDSLFKLNPRDNCASITPELENNLYPDSTNGSSSRPRRTHRGYGSLDNENDEVDHLLPSTKTASALFVPLLKTHGLRVLLSHFFKLIYDLLQFVSPMILKLLIGYTTNFSEPGWHGYIYAFALLAAGLCASAFFHQFFHLTLTAAMHMKTGLTCVIYKKALIKTRRGVMNSNEILNLVSVDTERLVLALSYAWALWSVPLQISLAFVMLWDTLGASAFVGAGVLLLLVPVNAFIVSRLRGQQAMQMKFKDKRSNLLGELISSIKAIKLNAWEIPFGKKVADIREQELLYIRKSAFLDAISTMTMTFAPCLVLLSTFLTYVYGFGETLTVDKAFVSLSLFNILSAPLTNLSAVIAALTQAYVSLGRIRKFLEAETLDKSDNGHCNSGAAPSSQLPAIRVSSGSFAWDFDSLPAINNINLQVDHGKLVAVVGRVGCGKTSLLSAILGDMRAVSGTVSVNGSVAYVAQQAWIQNATVRDNILFGKHYNEERYNKTLRACSLTDDIREWKNGDQTIVGEKGVGLSGGQKQRINLARAVYQDCDIYLLDDPLSAVDPNVGHHIFKRVIGPKGILSEKTRVFVTHGLQYLPPCGVIAVMKDGEIAATGSYADLQKEDGWLLNFGPSNPSATSTKDSILSTIDALKTTEEKPKPTAIFEEAQAVGGIKFSVFLVYGRALGLWVFIIWFTALVASQAASVMTNIWLSRWTSDPELTNMTLANTTEYKERTAYYFALYGGTAAAQGILAVIYLFFYAISTVRAAKSLHSNMLDRILRCPMSFFDTTPSGRILNRFSKDCYIVDGTLPQTTRAWLATTFGLISTFVVIIYGFPLFATILVPLGVVYYLIQMFYVPTARQLKRIELTALSPIYNFFSESVSGAATIRAFGATDRFIDSFVAKVDNYNVPYFGGFESNRWLGVRLELIGNLTITAVSLFAIYYRGSADSALVALAITYSFQVTSALAWLIRYTSDIQTNVVSVERMDEYTKLESEAPWEGIDDDHLAPPEWPSQGAIRVCQYSTRYPSRSELALNELSCDIRPGEKVGIVGRTGAGKSTVTQAIFRLLEPVSGKIYIDNVDITKLGLHRLRSRLAILPQEPMVFSCSIRDNLDPLGKHRDETLWKVLELAGLQPFVSSLAEGLEHECGENGDLLSVGQRQMLCLARALLNKKKILVLDEATASLDAETDQHVGRIIREEFSDCTILTVAHRLNTILDSNSIMVLNYGKVAEFNSPEVLLADKNGMFAKMAAER